MAILKLHLMNTIAWTVRSVVELNSMRVRSVSIFSGFLSPNILETARSLIRYYCISESICKTHFLVRCILRTVRTFLGHRFFLFFQIFFSVPFTLFTCCAEYMCEKNGPKRRSAIVCLCFAGMLTQWRVFRVYFNTLSSWALGKFQFCTMAIEPQNLRFNSCLIFNEFCFHIFFYFFFLLFRFFCLYVRSTS